MLSKPIILKPGNPKALKDNKCYLGSTSSLFKTFEGNFNLDGVNIGDYLLGLTGRNKGEQRKIIQVNSNFLTTESFPNSWLVDDIVKVFSKEERPTMLLNKLKLHMGGLTDPATALLVFTTENSGLEPIRVYAEKTEFYKIDSGNDTLILKVNGNENTVLLTHGSDRTALSIVNEINSFFPFTVAFIEQPSLTKPAIFYIQGSTVKISPTNAVNYFCICVGNFIFAKTVASTGLIGSGSKCLVRVDTSSNRTIDVSIDGMDLQATIPDNSSLNAKEVAESMNVQAGRCVATSGPDKVILLAEKNININQDVSFLGLKRSAIGLANLKSTEWSLDLNIFANESKINFIAIDEDGNQSEPSELDLKYTISKPLLTPAIQEIVDNNIKNCIPYLPTENIDQTISGTYDTEGSGVMINGQNVYSSGGNYTKDLLLEDGENIINLQTLDKFGNSSGLSSLIINYTDPNTLPLITKPVDAKAIKWKSVTTPSFAPVDIENTKVVIGEIFKPVIQLLDGTANLLVIARAFIINEVVSFLNVLRKYLQKLIDDVLQFLKDLSSGLGIWVISTLPRSFNTADPLDYISRLQLGERGRAFDGFLDLLIDSFDDIFDPKRPQLGLKGHAGAYVIAVADTGGLKNFWDGIEKISQVFQKEVLSHAISAPTDIRVSNENQRVVLTWKAPGTMRPGSYSIFRSHVSGGEQSFKSLKTNVPKTGKPQSSQDVYLDAVSGTASGEYTKIGVIDFNPATTIIASSLMDQIDFRFIDGVSTEKELEEKKDTEETLSKVLPKVTDPEKKQEGRGLINAAKFLKEEGVGGLLDKVKDSLLVKQGSSDEALVNGQTYYYRIVSEFFTAEIDTSTRVKNKVKFKLENTSGVSYEVMATPHAQELIYIQEEDLFSQYKKNEDVNYVLKGGIFDKTKVTYASNPPSSHIEIKVNDKVVTPKTIFYNQGIFSLNLKNDNVTSIKASYWTKKVKNTTRAKLTGKKSGPFVFNKTNSEDFTIELIVGPKSSVPLFVGLEDYTGISLVQKITLVRDFGNRESIELQSDEVASIIRDQTGGLRVSVDRYDRIVLIDNQYANPALGSEIKILKGNKVLGFDKGDIDSAGQFGTPPDWYRVGLADFIPQINDVMRYVENTAQNILSSLEDVSNALTVFLDTLIKRIETFTEILNKLQEMVESLADILTFKAGFWLLEIPPKEGGTEYLKSSLRNSIERPEADFAGGIMFVYGDGGLTKTSSAIAKNSLDLLFKQK